MREVATGVWHWQAPHPEWAAGDDWEQVVSSYAIDDGDHLLLFDPLGVPAEIEQLAAGRETAIVLTCPWHERDARDLVERLGVPVFTPPPDEGSADVSWLAGAGAGGRLFQAGERLPIGVHAFPGMRPNDLMLWVESRSALVAGDTLIDRGNGLEVPRDWASEAVPAEQVVDGLRVLLELPVELVLATHGAPADRAALERALG
jgi:glyoxylase-like metal-dependent hydrolase (beta-lactamase superfamily II)